MLMLSTVIQMLRRSCANSKQNRIETWRRKYAFNEGWLITSQISQPLCVCVFLTGRTLLQKTLFFTWDNANDLKIIRKSNPIIFTSTWDISILWNVFRWELGLGVFAERFCSNSNPSASAAFMLIGAVFKVNVVPLNPLKRDHPTLWSLFFLFILGVFFKVEFRTEKRYINLSKFTKWAWSNPLNNSNI